MYKKYLKLRNHMCSEYLKPLFHELNTELFVLDFIKNTTFI